MLEKSQHKIYIDTSDRKEKKIILQDLAGKQIDVMFGDIDLISSLKILLEKHSLDPKDIQIYESNIGPGSFTGLKIGVTTVNVINWSLGKKTASEMAMPVYGQEPNIHPTNWIEK